MNKIFNLSAIITAFLAFSVVVSAQTTPSAAELFKKYADALGGKEAAAKIKNRVSKGTMEINPVGVTGTFESITVAPNKSYLLMNILGFGDSVEVYDGTESWSKDPMSGFRLKDGEELKQAKQMADFSYDFNLESHYPEATVTGTEKVGESDAYVVKGDEDTTFYFDTKTGLLVRSDKVAISPQGRVNMQSYQSNYQEVDGIKIAFDIRALMANMEMVTKTTEVKQNVEIEDTKFNKPE